MHTLIDTHIHFYNKDNNINSWIGSNLPHKVDPIKNYRYVHIEAHDENIDTIKEYKYIESLGANIKTIAFLDFNKDLNFFENEVKRLSSYKNIVGVRQIMSYKENTNYSFSKFKELPSNLLEKLIILKKYNLVFESQMYVEQYFKVIDIIIQSEVTTIIEHMGLSFSEKLKDLIKIINNSDNIYMKLSSLNTFDLNNLENLNTQTNINHISLIIKNLNESKMLFGSNYPVAFLSNKKQWFELIDSLIEKFNKSKQKIFVDNAKKVYKFI